MEMKTETFRTNGWNEMKPNNLLIIEITHDVQIYVWVSHDSKVLLQGMFVVTGKVICSVQAVYNPKCQTRKCFLLRIVKVIINQLFVSK